jgi:hypothetical protein
MSNGDGNFLSSRGGWYGVKERCEFGQHDRAAGVGADIAAAKADAVDVTFPDASQCWRGGQGRWARISAHRSRSSRSTSYRFDSAKVKTRGLESPRPA